MSDPLTALADRAGIAPRYHDTTGTERHTDPESARALLAAMDLAAETDAEAAETAAALEAEDAARPLPRWIVVTADREVTLHACNDGPWTVTREDGGVIEGTGAEIALPPLPAGYHKLRVGGTETLLLCAPDALPLPAPGWGVTLPLYGLRTAERGGFGDYADLAAAIRALTPTGAGFVGINPIHAGFPEDPGAFSPYTPSHRRRLNIAHIAVEGADGATDELIDYTTDLPAKRAALEAAFAARTAEDDAALDAFLMEGGLPLRRFATHQALSERYGPYWPDWPAEMQDPASPSVALFASEQVTRVRFHAWAQWMATRQLDAVREAGRAMPQGLYLDLAVGTHPGGAETWEDPKTFARGVSLGAPPDAFSPAGQSWSLAPFNPRALEAADFRPLSETLRAQFRFSGMLRIDHILGFARAFWVPDGDGLPGAYVTMPKAAMLAVARIEAARAGAVIVGEDLGNVPEALRDDMARSGILGCRVALFERDPHDHNRYRAPEAYDTDTLAAFATHDLPTWAGWRAARDVDWWQRIGQMDAGAADSARAARAADIAAFDAHLGGTDGAAERLHDHLARATSRLVAVQAEDMLGHAEQPNLPGTVFEHPNWRRRLGVAPESLADAPGVVATADVMSRHRPN